ncbi:MAG: hypothetical protein JW882_05975 [Deltaproteobacteria bacterium]|nr:hypothetical protein [Deltaproteobacteria bacterium]
MVISVIVRTDLGRTTQEHSVRSPRRRLYEPEAWHAPYAINLLPRVFAVQKGPPYRDPETIGWYFHALWRARRAMIV